MTPSILIVDNYDSFTNNLTAVFAAAGASVDVLQNDAPLLVTLPLEAYDGYVFAPGPGLPSRAGYAPALMRRALGRKPVLGVCLGCQMLAEVAGGNIRHEKPVYGKTSRLTHDRAGCFSGLPPILRVMRYHAWAVAPETLPKDWRVSATAIDGVVMGIRNDALRVEGLQFHPESISTEYGERMLQNWLAFGSGGNTQPGCAL